MIVIGIIEIGNEMPLLEISLRSLFFSLFKIVKLRKVCDVLMAIYSWHYHLMDLSNEDMN